MNQKPYILYLKNGNQAFLEQLRHRLTQSGYSMIGTYYNERTLELIRNQKPDVLVLDLTKQDCENWCLFRQIKADKSLAGISIIDVSTRVAEKGRIVLEDQIQPDLERMVRSIEILARKSQPLIRLAELEVMDRRQHLLLSGSDGQPGKTTNQPPDDSSDQNALVGRANGQAN